MESITNEVLNVLFTCGWKTYRGEYVRYHEGCNYSPHNQGGNAYGGINLSSTNFTPRRQDGVGNFSPRARSFDHTSYNLYEENRIEVEKGIAYRPFERVPRKETRNEKDYVNMDERRRKGVGFNTWSRLKGALSVKFGVSQFERLEWSQSMGNSKGKQEIIEIDKSFERHIEGEKSKEEFGDSRSDLSLEEEESIEFERKDRVEEKEKLVRSLKQMTVLKKKRVIFRKIRENKRTKEMSEEKQENSKEELDRAKQELRGKTYLQLHQNNKLLSLTGEHFVFLNSLGTYLERRYFIKFNSLSCATPRVDENDFNIANFVSHLLGVEDRRSTGKELGPILEDILISLSLNHSSLCHDVSQEELKSLLDSYNFQVSLIGDMCIIAFEGKFFLLVPSMTNCLSSHLSHEDPLMSSRVIFDPSCYGFGNLDDTSFVELNIVALCLDLMEFSPTYLHHNINARKEAHHGVRRPRQKCWRKTNATLWRFDNKKKINGSLKVFKAHLCDLVKTTFGNGVFELNLKILVEKHLVYSSAFVYFLFKGEALNEKIVQNTKSCVKIENQSLGANLLYSLTFKEFLDELIFKRELKVLRVLMLNQECSLLNNVLKLFWKKSCQNFAFYHLPFKEILWKLDLAKEQEWFEDESFKGWVDGMTRKVQGTVKLLQGPVTRAMARRMEEQHRGKITRFKKIIQDLAWKVIGDQEEDFQRSKTVLCSCANGRNQGSKL
ncbi:hypothetical protein M9H77_17716 [Catharanthus roseus]|uniref:Uncharacterized protein n=1 Tax=Catharanthus roseus TaxID=4058 RepID=A0ACC0B5D8_CATRO|nr:hypothetical protein M9H77_17716 [Catharanthus roseus]